VTHYSFCPVCGAPLDLSGGAVAVRDLHTCVRCGFEFWQNSKPAVGALVVRTAGGARQILLTRRGIDPYKGMWDLPGGYLKNGEAPEAGLAREIREELGTTISGLRFVMAGIDEYPREDVAEEARFVLSMHYRCEMPADAVLRPGDDVAEARWFPIDALPADIAFMSNRRAIAALIQDLAGRPRDGLPQV
jgi:ADP-ribose pyrophosphatase YjhB (NUDIX family)